MENRPFIYRTPSTEYVDTGRKQSKTNIYHLWIQYTTQNDEQYFWQFIYGFVEIWQSQVALDFSAIPLWSEIAPDSVPVLAKLPDELLAAIGKFLYISKENTQNAADGVDSGELFNIELLLKCLMLICRNFDNIPLIASCDYVSLSASIVSKFIERLLNDEIPKDETEIDCLKSVIISFCHFLEVLYDPYLTWRNYLSNHVADFSKLIYRPALLHVEVVPFIYDCFQSTLIDKYPATCVELLNVLGATISGAQSLLSMTNNCSVVETNIAKLDSTADIGNGHNALRSVCPATVSLIIKIISTIQVDKDVRQTALDCFTCMVQVLYKSTPEQRQIELSIILDMYTDSINKTLLDIPIDLTSDNDDHKISREIIDNKSEGEEESNENIDDPAKNVQRSEDIGGISKQREQASQMLCSTLTTIRKLLEDFEDSRVVLCKLLLDIRFLHLLISLPDNVVALKLDDQSLGIECVRTLTWLLLSYKTSKKPTPDDWRYDDIVSKWIHLNTPSRQMLKEFLHMSVDGRKPNNQEPKLCNPEVIIVLIQNLHLISENDQVWISQKISWLSTKDLRSKWLVCQHGAIMEICNILSKHNEIVSKPIISLINLLDNLACTSITSQELKQIILLLRKEKTFSHRIPLLHTLCNITRKGYFVCKAFLDVQSESDGISVSDINKWNNTSYGISFHCWICLDRLPQSHDSYGKHRQLLSLLTQIGQGLEVFIDQSGGLTINILKKNAISPAHVPSAGLDDNRWHSVSVCLAFARRALSHNQISVFIDGTQRLSTSVKFSSFDDVFSHCVIGAPVSQEARQSNKRTDNEKESFHGTLVKNLFSNQFLPNIVLQAPSYLSFGTMGSKTNQSNAIDTSQNNQNLTPLHGHIAHASLFNETFTQSAAKWLYEAGMDCHTSLCSEETPESQEMFNRLVFCYSALATWDGYCMNLASSSGNYQGSTTALRVNTTNVKEVINAISNVHVFFPLLEDEVVLDDSDLDMDVFCSMPNQTNSNEQSPQLPDWEIVPSNAIAELKLDHNPISMFLTLLKNSIVGSHLNQEELAKNEGVTTIGMLLCQCKPSLVDVNVLMATQLLVETVRDLSNPTLLQALYNNILFNFKIWSRSAFLIRIGHIQYISNLIKHERTYFRKHFGVQYFLDVIRTYYANSDNLSVDDAKTIRLALLSVVKYFLSKDININELLSVIQFLESVKEEALLVECIDMLVAHMESKNCKDQIYLLLHEKCIGETLYVLLLNRAFSVEFRVTLIKFLLLVVRTERVNFRNKSSMLLQDGNVSMFPGLIGYMDPKYFSLDLATHMFDLMIYGESKGGYAGILALLHCLTFDSIDVKLELAKKLLTATFINLNSPFLIAKQVGWQDCIARLLIKRCISETAQVEEAIDLMTFDEESLKLEPDSGSFSHAHIPSLSEAANVIEHEIKEIAGSVSEAVADNLQYAADNLSTAVASVCSVIRQKTVDIQESLGELGHIGRVHHLPSFNEGEVEYNADSDSVTVSNRSVSTSSIDEDVRDSVESSGYKTGDTDDSKMLSETLLPSDLDLGDKYVDKEENLSYLVANILFTILWRGVEGFSKESWKERGQVMACINLLALNNELYCSHLQLRLRLLELGVQAALVDLKDTGNSSTSAKYNALYLMRLVFDLVVLDPNKDETKKCSVKLLDGVLALLDALKVFTEDDMDPLRRELARLGLGVVVACACSTINCTSSSTSAPSTSDTSSRSSLAAPACALLHSLLRSPGGMGTTSDTETETAYLLCSVGVAMKQAVEVGNHDQYSFLLPVMKALLEKVRSSMNVNKYLPDLPRTNVGPVFFSDFQTYIQGEQWSHFIEYKVRPLSIAYDRETNSLVGEPLNTFWAECYEACKAGANVRAREQLSSKSHFQTQVILSFKNWRAEDLQRLGGLQNQLRSKEAKAATHWKAKKSFLTGPRGAWNAEDTPDSFWCLSPHENLSRMRLRLEPTTRPAYFAAAARLRDNLGRGPTTKAPQPALAPPAKTTRPEDEAVLEDEFRLSLEPEIQPVESGKEKMVISQECELVSLMTKVKGRLDVTTSCLYFHDLSPVKEEIERQDFIIPLAQLREIHLRRYNLRRSALEIFLIDQTNYFLNFTTKTRNTIFTKILSLQPPNILYGSGQSPSELLRASGLTQKWVNREITNFDYLMHLNTIAGRTYNDLSQYPVYPWILADYHSERLNLDDPATFRDLSKPIGVVNSKNEAEVKAKYDNFEDPTGVISKFHYGTHYSNSAGVLHYLLRVEPFTSLHVELQSGRFDVADRQFHSIAQTWKLLMNNPNDVKELTPEFFYFPEFLKNINSLDLGILQGTSQRVGDVILPPWAENNAENFIYLHRKALESDYVSENLNNWIDLIFGYKQRGPRAVEALNVFYYCSYEGAVDLDAIADPAERAAVEGMIANFGQTPAQLVRGSPHPTRLTTWKVVQRALRGEVKTLDCLQVLSQLQTTFVQVSRAEDPILWLGGPVRARGFLQGGGRWVTALTKGGTLLTPPWSPNSTTGAPLEADSTTNTLKNRRQINIIGKKRSSIDNKAIAMSSDGKILYTGGHWDCSIKVYAISSKVKLLHTVIRHFGPVTCLALDSCSEHWLVSGSQDTSLTVWEVGTTSNGSLPLVKHSLCGHDAPVTCVAVMAELDVVVSGSQDGTVNIYSLKKGEYIQTLKPEGCMGHRICVKYIVLTHQGHIGYIVDDEIYNSIHVFTINGSWRASRNVCGRVKALSAVGDCMLIGDDAGDITISTSQSLKPVYDVPLHTPIEHVLITPNNTHILVTLVDGKVAVVGLPPPKKNMNPIDVI